MYLMSAQKNMVVRVVCIQKCLKGGGCTKKAPMYISMWTNNEVAERSARPLGRADANFNRGRHKVLPGRRSREANVPKVYWLIDLPKIVLKRL
jgi:hypothetical protein